MDLRVLLLADTHLGFDEPRRPRVDRPRRGPDFFANYERALEPARRGEADLVVHAGDLLYRSRVPASLAVRALEPLVGVARGGVPVLLVPGNHERSRMPFPLLARHPRLHVFDAPRTVALEVGGLRVAASGFPFARRVDGAAFPRLLERTGWRRRGADVRLLCLHQAVEGATVGVHDFTFRRGPDVVPRGAIPEAFAAVLAGHVHRAQLLAGTGPDRPRQAPVCYPGSVERTSFAEREEEKGYLRLRFAADGGGGRLLERVFVPLPTRPMRVVALDATGLAAPRLAALLAARLGQAPPRALVRLEVRGQPGPSASRLLRAARLRALAPPDTSVTVRWRDAPPEALRAPR